MVDDAGQIHVNWGEWKQPCPRSGRWTASTLRTCQEQRGPNSSHPGNKQPEVRLGDLACRTACHLVGSNPACGCHPAGQESFRADGGSHRKAEPSLPVSLYGIYHQVDAGLHVTLRSWDRHFFIPVRRTTAEGKNMALPDGAMPGRSVRNIARSRTPRTSC